MSEEKNKLPSAFSMVKSFAKDIGKYVKEGAPNVSEESYAKRLEACGKCPFLIKEKMRCGKCGCLVEHKAKWKTTTCPDAPSKWAVEILTTKSEHETKKSNSDNSDQA
tara:strand:- start:1278 stop:1601 length:324 start_codon:yes stop_codon:yes gene_type:complete